VAPALPGLGVVELAFLPDHRPVVLAILRADGVVGLRLRLFKIGPGKY
jgi:hypothetical protein